MYVQAVRGTCNVMSDNKGYTLSTGYKLPNYLDMQYLVHILKEKKESCEVVVGSRNKILKACNKKNGGKDHKRLIESLKRWEEVQLNYDKSFYEEGEKKSKTLKILDSWDYQSGIITVSLNEEWVKCNDLKYSLWLPADYYGSLSSKTMRLFEILYPMKRIDTEISLIRLGEKLTIKATQPAHVLSKIKPSLLEIKEKTKEFANLKWEIKDKEGRRKDRAILFRDNVLGNKKAISKKIDKIRNCKRLSVKNKEPIKVEIEHIDDKLHKEHIETLWRMVKKKSKGLKKIIEEYYRAEGFKYVRWNIKYSNEHAKKNYSTYLQKALKENWAFTWSEEVEKEQKERVKKQEVEIKQRNEKKEKEREKEKAEEQKPEFLSRIEGLEEETKIKLWRQAESEIEEKAARRSQLVKMKYAELILETLNGMNCVRYSREILNDFRLVLGIKQPIGEE